MDSNDDDYESDTPLNGTPSSLLLRSISSKNSASSPLIENSESLLENIAAPVSVKKYAYVFDGNGNFRAREWKLKRDEPESSFSWYHIEIPRSCQSLSSAALALINILYPVLSLQEITTLISNGPFCGVIKSAIIFRINCTGPMSSPYTFRVSAHVTGKAMISVSLGRLQRLEFVRPMGNGLSELRKKEEAEQEMLVQGSVENDRIEINEELLEELLRKNHPQDADNPIPTTIAKLLIHFVDTFMDQLQDMVVDVEVELEELERKMDKGDGNKRWLLKKRIFPRMKLDLQKILQTVAHGEVVFPKVKQKLVGRNLSCSEDLAALDNIMSRLRRNKENVGFLASRITALQASLDQWQSEQINRKLYYLSFLSMVFLPLSVVTGVFGMNVGGVPWVPQVTTDPNVLNGFANVMWMCGSIVLLMLVAFGSGPLFQRAKKYFNISKGLSKTRMGTYFKEKFGLKEQDQDDQSLIL